MGVVANDKARRQREEVRRALKRLARVPGSKFIVSKRSDPASGGIKISFQTFRDVVAWASSVRREKLLCNLAARTVQSARALDGCK